MFICTDLSQLGVNDTKELLNELHHNGIRDVCLLEDYGIGVTTFLKHCKEKKMRATVAFELHTFIENSEVKKKVYLFCTVLKHYSQMVEWITEIKESFLPFISKKKAEEYKKKGILVFVQRDGTLYEEWLTSQIDIEINPILFKNEAEKKMFPWLHGQSVQHRMISTKNEAFIQKIVKEPSQWESVIQCFETKTIINEIKENWAVQVQFGQQVKIVCPDRRAKIEIESYIRKMGGKNPVSKNRLSFQERIKLESRHQRTEYEFYKRIKREETCDEFICRQKILLMMDDKKREIVDKASIWEGRRKQTPDILSNVWVFPSKSNVIEEDTVYALEEEMQSIVIF